MCPRFYGNIHYNVVFGALLIALYQSILERHQNLQTNWRISKKRFYARLVVMNRCAIKKYRVTTYYIFQILMALSSQNTFYRILRYGEPHLYTSVYLHHSLLHKEYTPPQEHNKLGQILLPYVHTDTPTKKYRLSIHVLSTPVPWTSTPPQLLCGTISAVFGFMNRKVIQLSVEHSKKTR